jgi:hypothetical protein
MQLSNQKTWISLRGFLSRLAFGSIRRFHFQGSGEWLGIRVQKGLSVTS